MLKALRAASTIPQPNPNNLDPDQWVGYGDRTVDEMAHAWANVTYISDDDYKAWLAQHPQRLDSRFNRQP